MKWGITTVSCVVIGAVSVVGAWSESRTITSATDGNWEDASSWVDLESGASAVPSSEDTVIIDSHTIVMNSGEEVAAFHLKRGMLDVGMHNLITGGQGSWDEGVITGSGSFDNRGNLTLADSPTKTLQGVLNNYQTVSHDKGNLNLAYESILVNRKGSVYELTSDANITGLLRWDATPRFINQGTFRKAAGTAASRIEVVFNNIGGTIEVDNGTLTMVGTGAESSVHSNGVFEVSEGAVLDLVGNNVNVFNGSFTGSGEGLIQFDSGVMKLGTDFNEVTFDFGGGGFVWQGGSIEPTLGALVNHGKFTIDGDGVKNLGEGPGFSNRGQVQHRGQGNLNLEYGATCRNEKGAVYEIQSDVSVMASGGEGPKPTFENDGSFRKTDGQGMSSIRAPFNNGGEVEVGSGVLNFTDSYVQREGITRLRGGDLMSSASVDIEGGILAGAGRVFASVNSSGTLTPGNSAGTMIIHGDYRQGETGRLEMEIGGTAAGDEYDQLQVLGGANMVGSLSIVLMDGYVPAAGDVFDIIRCQSCVASFGTVDLPELPRDLAWDMRAEHNAIRLFVVRNGDH